MFVGSLALSEEFLVAPERQSLPPKEPATKSVSSDRSLQRSYTGSTLSPHRVSYSFDIAPLDAYDLGLVDRAHHVPDVPGHHESGVPRISAAYEGGGLTEVAMMALDSSSRHRFIAARNGVGSAHTASNSKWENGWVRLVDTVPWELWMLRSHVVTEER